MPNPLLEPIIGRDFSDIGAQRYAWAGFNANIEAQNLARAAAAEEAQNRWTLTAAQMAREDAARQAAIDARAQENALTLGLSREQEAYRRAQDAVAAKAQESQFTRDLGFRREALAAQGEQAGEKLKLMEAQQKARIDYNGERFATQFGLLKVTSEQANDAADKAVSAFERAKADQMRISLLPKKNEEDMARLQEIGRTFAELERDARIKAKAAEHANADFGALKAKMGAQDYEWNERTGTVSHPLGTREWSFAKAVAEAGGNAAKPPPAAPVTVPKGTSGPGWFTRNVFQPVYGVGQNLGRWLSTPSSRPVAPVALTPTRYGGVLTPGHDLDYENAVALPLPPPAQPIATNQPLTGRFVRDASGRLVLERY